MESLNNAWNEASSQMYQNVKESQPAAGPGAPSGSAQQQAPKDDTGKKVENADFEVVDDKDDK